MPLNLCGGVNGDVLLREVLCSTGMVRYVGDGRSKVKAQLCLLCVADLVDVIEDSGNKVVDSCLGNVVASDDDCCNSNGGHVFGSVVDVLGDGVLFVVGAGSDQAVNVLLVEGDEVDLLAGAEVLNCGGGSACDNECCVDLAVLEAVCGIAEVKILCLDVVFGQAVCAEKVKCVEVNAMETVLPLRSATVLMSGLRVTIWTCSM